MVGWITMHRKFMKWEWYTDTNMVHLFLHLLLSANHKDGRWKGRDVLRGQLITGRKALAVGTGISEMRIRTCLKRLEDSGEISIKSTSKYSVITIIKYDVYQSDKPEVNQQLTSNQPATNQQLTTNNNVNNENNDKQKRFLEFWDAYRNKKSRGQAEKAWKKIKAEDYDAVILAAKADAKANPTNEYRKHPSTWLNAKCWEDEECQPVEDGAENVDACKEALFNVCEGNDESEGQVGAGQEAERARERFNARLNAGLDGTVKVSEDQLSES